MCCCYIDTNYMNSSSVPNVPQIVPENKGRNACTSMCIKVTLCHSSEQHVSDDLWDVMGWESVLKKKNIVLI